MKIKILVADDSASDRFIIKNMLSEYCILTASDGVEAIKILEEHDGINLLILDLNMPNKDGFQVLEYLKENERYSNLRTIILTIYDELENEIKGLRLGAIDYIRKPVQMDSLKARIDVHTALIRAEEALKQQLNEQTLTFDMLFEQAPIGIAISYNSKPEKSNRLADTNNTNEPNIHIVRINKVYEQITGRTKEELIKMGWAKITHPDDLEVELEKFKKLQAGEIKSYSMEKRFIKPDGTIAWVYKTAAALETSGKNSVNHICIVQDITEKKQLEIERRYIAEHDKWTGLYNREYMVSLLKKHIKLRKNSKKALIGINLSMVQLLTANYGYQYSQNLIKKASEALIQCCNENRILFYPRENRFIFYVLDYKDKKELLEFSSEIVEALESIFITDSIGGGIGILEIGQQEKEIDIDLLLSKLVVASEKSIGFFGKNFQVCFYNKELEKLVDRERDIVETLNIIASTNYENYGENYGDSHQHYELFLQYQPVMDIRTGAISSFEALARLRTKKLGLVSPLEFIPIAEKTKLIIPIGEKVFIKAFSFLKRLRKNGYNNISVSINVSVIQLLSPDFTSRLFELLSDMQVEPHNICIEITESIFASEYDNINNVIKKLQEAGLHVAIDDFGTGYSSLARQRELKVNCMKIDKFFIDKLTCIEPNKAITGDIISIAHKLGHYTIAEGVENNIQLQYLKDHHCDRIQGYLISKPVDEEDALEFLKNWTV